MNEPPGFLTEEVTRLRRCLNDLVSLIAQWDATTSSEPAEMVSAALDALLKRLPLAFVFVRLTDPEGAPFSETARVAELLPSTLPARHIGQALDSSWGEASQRWPAAGRAVVGDIDLSTASARLGIQGDLGILVAGFHRTASPGQTDHLLLAVAANHLTIGLQQARQLNVQRRMVHDVEQRVAQRTAELAAANSALTAEIAERRRTEETRASELRHAFDEIRTFDIALRQDHTPVECRPERTNKTALPSSRALLTC